MVLLNDDVKQRLGALLDELAGPVELALYSGPEGEAGEIMRTLMEEVVACGPGKLSLRPLADAPAVEPGRESAFAAEGPILTVAPAGATEARMRFLGVTGGHEFGAFVAAIQHAAADATDVSGGTVTALGGLGHRVHIQVFTTPT